MRGKQCTVTPGARCNGRSGAWSFVTRIAHWAPVPSETLKRGCVEESQTLARSQELCAPSRSARNWCSGMNRALQRRLEVLMRYASQNDVQG